MTASLVLHVFGPASTSGLEGAARIVHNAQADLSEHQIELVLQGPIVSVVTDPNQITLVEELVSGGVAVSVCANSLRSAGLPVDTVPEAFTVVPAAITHLARRQWEGWAYVRI